jgi:hypothetical protein
MAKSTTNGTVTAKDEEKEPIATRLWKFIKDLKIELVFAFYAVPGYLCIVALLFLPIEKACRNNLGYADAVCDQLNNGTLKAACGPIYEFEPKEANNTENELQAILDQIGVDYNFTSTETLILRDICTAETEAQKLQVNINQIRALLEYLGLVVILYIGPLGDKYNKKKLFLLLPMLGELVNVLAYLTTSVFKSSVPMEFHLIVERLMYSLSGSFALMLMGIFAFLAAYTDEKDRTFRFGVFSVFNSGLGTVAQQFAAPAFLNLGYVKLFALSAGIHILGVLFIIFCIEEVPATKTEPVEAPPKDGVENAGYSGSTLELQDRNKPPAQVVTEAVEEARFSFKRMLKGSWTLFASNFEIYKILRPANGRLLLFLITGAQVCLLLVTGENDVSSLYGRQAWGWTTEFGDYSAYNTFMSFIGTIIVTTVFVKFFKLTDPILAIVSLTCNLISKPILALTKKTFLIYTASTIDMFNSAPAIAVRSLLSKVVLPNELGRCYTVIALLEVLVHPIASIIYNTTYQVFIESFPGMFYFFSVTVLAICIIDFLRIHVLFPKFEKKTEEIAAAAVAAAEKRNEVTDPENLEVYKL